MHAVLLFRTRGTLYPYWYQQEFVDSYGVKMIRCKHYNVKHGEIEQTATLKKDVRQMFLVLTDDIDRTLTTKYVWRDG